MSDHFLSLLEAKEKELEKALSSIKERTFSKSQKDVTGEMSSYDQHLGDLGLSTFERGKDLGLKDDLMINLRRTRLAIERVRSGQYGYCLACGRPVERGRLLSLPEAELCIECQKRQEVAPPQKRPVEENFSMGGPMVGLERLSGDLEMRGEDRPRPSSRK